MVYAEPSPLIRFLESKQMHCRQSTLLVISITSLHDEHDVVWRQIYERTRFNATSCLDTRASRSAFEGRAVSNVDHQIRPAVNVGPRCLIIMQFKVTNKFWLIQFSFVGRIGRAHV